eukprot:TRINITY_DN9816_c0_g1_i2.p1 TRINITY_DN9816_c0_g1~~TRINITY_DN9816_c0_g1_i2.p1  ORF type:complete len:293 (+),score=53.52 TRINITY_DN9816_c0_g1_i2:70-948(+)
MCAVYPPPPQSRHGEEAALLGPPTVPHALGGRPTPFPAVPVVSPTVRDRIKLFYASPVMQRLYWWAMLATGALLIWCAVTWDVRSRWVMAADGALTALFAGEVLLRSYAAGHNCTRSGELLADGCVCLLCLAVYGVAATCQVNDCELDDDWGLDALLLGLRYTAQGLRVLVLYLRQRGAADRQSYQWSRIQIGRAAADAEHGPASARSPALTPAAGSPQWSWAGIPDHQWAAMRSSAEGDPLLGLPAVPHGGQPCAAYLVWAVPAQSPRLACPVKGVPIAAPPGHAATVPME